MELQANIDPKEVEREVVQTILDSALGEKVKAVIQQEIARLGQSWGGSSALQTAIQQEVCRIVLETIRQEYLETIRTAVRQRLTDTLVDSIVNAAWKAFMDNVERGR